MKLVVWLMMIALSGVAVDAGATPGQGQELAALRAELDVLKAAQTLLQQDLKEIKQLLQVRAAPPAPEADPDRVVAVAGSPSKGEPGASVTVIEFSDFQCPFCGRYVRDTLSQIEKAYVSTGKVRYVFRTSRSSRFIRWHSRRTKPRVARPSRESSGRCTRACSRVRSFSIQNKCRSMRRPLAWTPRGSRRACRRAERRLVSGRISRTGTVSGRTPLRCSSLA